MREIKFRAWDKKNKWMGLLTSIDMWLAIDGRLYEEPNKRYDTPHTEITRSRDHYELIQFMGLKDGNGKEIYEGDIVQNPGGYNYEIEFVDGSFIPAFDAKPYWHEQFKVIGNIYENPELLK